MRSGYAAEGVPLRETSEYARSGDRVAPRESDPSLMLGVVILVAANTIVIAALIGAVIWAIA
ncbi:MAG TPA: hypothetical protein VHH57_04045 [Gaiella sp.]|jgi:hypothetical protein|nr:hypothetical protein [Gaiella sp.]